MATLKERFVDRLQRTFASNHVGKHVLFWMPVLVLLGLTLTITLSALDELLQYDRTAVQQGQWWRLISCNLTHLGWGHWWLNAAGLILIWGLFGAFKAVSKWLLLFVVTSISVSGGIYLFNPEVEWYAGLSGVLHGLFLVGAAEQLKIPDNRDWLNLAVASFFIAKLVWELFMGPLPGSEIAAGSEVLVEAHFYGAAGGMAWIAVGSVWLHWRKSAIACVVFCG